MGQEGEPVSAHDIKFTEYVALVAARVEEAADRGDRAEAIRLLRLLRDVAEEQAQKLGRQE